MAGVLRMLNPLAKSDASKKREAYEQRTKNLEGNIKITEGIILEIDTWKDNIVADFPDYKQQVEEIVSKITQDLSSLENTLAGANKFMELNDEITELIEDMNELAEKLSKVSDINLKFRVYRSNKQRKKLRYGKKLREKVEEYNNFVRSNQLKWSQDQLLGQAAFGKYREELEKLKSLDQQSSEENRLFKRLPGSTDSNNPGGDELEAAKIELRDEFRKMMGGGYTRKNRKNNRNNKNKRRQRRTRRRNN